MYGSAESGRNRRQTHPTLRRAGENRINPLQLVGGEPGIGHRTEIVVELRQAARPDKDARHRAILQNPRKRHLRQRLPPFAGDGLSARSISTRAGVMSRSLKKRPSFTALESCGIP